MPTLTPKATAALSRRTGLDFAAVRRSRLVRDLLALEASARATAALIPKLAARARAYKLARQCERSPSNKVDLRITEKVTRVSLVHERMRRTRLNREIASIKARIAAQAFPAPARETNDDSLRPTYSPDVNERLRKLFNV